jgi:hypothetical protein
VLEAIGHDGVLGLFTRGDTHWAVTEGCAARFDEAAGRWQKVVEVGFRYYWRATAAQDDNEYLHVGSDRGLISRLDLRTGMFDIATALKERRIERLARGADNRLVATGGEEPLGRISPHVRSPSPVLDADVAVFDGRKWVSEESAGKTSGLEAPWFFRQLEKRSRFDKSRGNFLFGPEPQEANKPKYYVKEVFFPRFLCKSRDGKRIWLSTFTGLLRLDLPEAE